MIIMSSSRRAAMRATVSLCALLAASVWPAGSALADDAADLPEVVITSQKETADTPVQGYRAKRASGATKTDTALIDTPQSVAVVPKDLLEDIGAHTADKALEYVPGTAKGNTFGGLNTYDTIIRGFRTSISGVNGFTAGRRFDASIDAANVERVEVLMGPSAQIYGRSDPGGMYNVVTKKPQAENFIETKAEYGSFNAYRLTIDANGIGSPDKSVLGRVNVAVEDKDSFRDYVSSERQMLAPSISWQGSGDTKAIFDAQYLHDSRTFDRGVVAVNGDVSALPVSRFLGNANDGRIKMDDLMASMRLEHAVNPDWLVRGVMMAKSGSLYGYATDATAEPTAAGTLTRRARLRDYYWNSTAGQVETVGHFSTYGMSHTMMSGVELDYSRSAERSRFGTATAINIWSPNSYTATPGLTSYSDLLDQTTKYAVYWQDQIGVTNQFELQLGLRWDGFDQHFERRQVNQKLDQSKSALSPRVGGLYKITPALSTYANVSKSFNKDPDASYTTDVNGQMFEPETGLGMEAGVKADVLKDALSITAATYRITKNNVVTADNDNVGFGKAAGKVRSRGFDINITGNLTPEWRVMGGYAYVDAEVLQDATVARGSNLQNIPMHSMPLFSVYEFQSGSLSGLGVGGGVTYVSKRAVDNGSAVYMPDYAKVDLLAYYKLNDQAKLSLNVNNLFDTGYYSSALGSTRVMPGEPLSIVGSLSLKF